MPTVSDSDIDPILLAESDPAMQLFQMATTRSTAAATLPSQTSFTNLDDSNGNSDNDDFDMPPIVEASSSSSITISSSGTSSNTTDSSNAHDAARLAVLGRTIKDIKKFKSKSEADIDRYCSALCMEERLLLAFAVNLEIRDRLEDITSPSNWTMSESLKKTVTLYSKVFVLSPTTQSYKGNGPAHILQAMRELNVADLPPEKEQLQVSEILSFISDRLTSVRNTVKARIKDSMEVDSALANVAHLTNALISKTPVKHTMQLYMRVAFLRWNMLTFGDGTEYWDKVDDTLAKWCQKATSAADLDTTFNHVYTEDKTKYGDPKATDYEVVQPGNVDEWSKTIQKHASVAQAAKKRKPG